MVSGSQVRSDANSLNTASSNYNSIVEGLSASWKGRSYDNLNSQAQQVSSEFISTISGQMSSFASACEMYEEYKHYKNQLNIVKNNYNLAVSSNDTSSANSFASQINSYSSKISSLKSQIESALASASGSRLDATQISTKDYSSGQTLSYGSASGVVQGAIDWAVAIAADNTHGYSQQTRWGNPNYDCSSLVISAFQEAGVGVKDVGASYTGNMRSAFIKAGFEWIPGTPNVNNLQPGDVLLNENHHTELYIGDGMNVGAHSNYDGRDGDSSGKEISITNYSNKNWDGVLRYVGYDSTKGMVA